MTGGPAIGASHTLPAGSRHTTDGGDGPEVTRSAASRVRRRTTWRAPAASSWAPYAAAVLTLAWAYRTTFLDGLLPGNTGDARWTVAVYDHWYRVWQGLDGVRDLLYYYPLKSTLGTSDAFFVQGQIYSLARVCGFGLVSAWLVATLGFALLGALGVAALSRRLFRSAPVQVAFVVLSVDCYAAVAAAGHVQLVGFYAGSWVVLGLLDIRDGRTLRGIAGVAVSSALIALSSWYAIVLLLMVLGFLWLVRLVLVRDGGGITRVLVGQVLTTIRSVRGAAAVAVGVAGWLVAFWIYLPATSVLPPPTWTDTFIYSPRWSDIWNASGNGGGVWAPLYDHLYPAMSTNSEQQLGFTPLVFLTLCAATLVVVRFVRPPSPVRPGDAPSAVDSRQWTLAERDAVVAAAMTCAVVVAFFLVDERGLGLFRPVWAHVPGMTSIRAPFRVMIYVYPLAFFVVLRTVELVLPSVRSQWRTVVAGLSVLLAVGMLVEMQRPLGSAWTRGDLLPSAVARDVPLVSRQCDAVLVASEDPSLPSYETQIDAVILSVESGVPTPQGYSRSNPKRYPDATQRPVSYLKWMRRNGYDGRLCVVSSEGVRRTR